jgi:hypothetical protein
VRIEYFLPRRREELERDAADQGIELVPRFRQLLGRPVDRLFQRIKPALLIIELSRMSLQQLLSSRSWFSDQGFWIRDSGSGMRD